MRGDGLEREAGQEDREEVMQRSGGLVAGRAAVACDIPTQPLTEL